MGLIFSLVPLSPSEVHEALQISILFFREKNLQVFLFEIKKDVVSTAVASRTPDVPYPLTVGHPAFLGLGPGQRSWRHGWARHGVFSCFTLAACVA